MRRHCLAGTSTNENVCHSRCRAAHGRCVAAHVYRNRRSTRQQVQPRPCAQTAPDRKKYDGKYGLALRRHKSLADHREPTPT